MTHARTPEALGDFDRPIEESIAACFPRSHALLEAARGELGVQEIPPGSNRGPRVEEYLSSVFLAGGNPWCAAFISWCARQAKATLLPRSGWTPAFLRAPGCRVAQEIPSTVAPGMLFLLFYPSLARVGHIGVIEGPTDNPLEATTIEGNSNDEGAREGYEVCRRTRRIDKMFALITY